MPWQSSSNATGHWEEMTDAYALTRRATIPNEGDHRDDEHFPVRSYEKRQEVNDNKHNRLLFFCLSPETEYHKKSGI